MKIIRGKTVECSWGTFCDKFYVRCDSDNYVFIRGLSSDSAMFTKDQVPNLIKALQEILK